ncbi:mRNA export factor, partial [Mytilus galloprovincialis]
TRTSLELNFKFSCGPAEGRLRVREFLVTLKTCWSINASFYILFHTMSQDCNTVLGSNISVAKPNFVTGFSDTRFLRGFKRRAIQALESLLFAKVETPCMTIWMFLCPTYDSRGALCFLVCASVRSLKFLVKKMIVRVVNIHIKLNYSLLARYPMAVVGTAGRELIIYQLENRPQEFSRIESPLKFQHRCISIFLDKKINSPTGFALGSIEGRVAIHYVNPTNPKDNFTFKCHRSNGATNGMQDIYAVNDISFHPIHGTLATVGSDCKFSFWDKDARTKLKTSELFDQPITACNFNSQGTVFAYATSYDWSKGHEGFDPQKKPHIFLRSCFDELKPSMKKS